MNLSIKPSYLVSYCMDAKDAHLMVYRRKTEYGPVIAVHTMSAWNVTRKLKHKPNQKFQLKPNQNVQKVMD